MSPSREPMGWHLEGASMVSDWFAYKVIRRDPR